MEHKNGGNKWEIADSLTSLTSAPDEGKICE
jgi:hypothetical protein